VRAGSLRSDGRRVAIRPADVSGRFTRARRVVFLVLIAIYVALPWIPVGGHPAVLLDIGGRRFYLFGATFNAQDVWMTVVLLLAVGLGLVLVTALLGRIWCGWACPQTVFLDGVYRRIERWLVGNRRKAGARDVIAHLLHAGVSVALAYVLLRYFTARPPPVLLGVLGAGLYANFAWFREQLCVVVCPYGRLQSVLIDADSLIVGYDARRGEPRGKVATADAGDCVDCRRCVQVCPTGIDIRDGLQLDCVACTACIDACDDVMDRLGRARGLVRYDSMNGLAGKPRRVGRPRVLAYAGILAAGGLAAFVALSGRRGFEANLLRQVGAPFVVEDEMVENRFQVHLVNKLPRAARFAVTAPENGDVAAQLPGTVELGSLADLSLPVIVRVPRGRWRSGLQAVLEVAVDGEEPRELRAPLLGPVSR
jgi:cytochrome c oxidase accessory protein FixG